MLRLKFQIFKKLSFSIQASNHCDIVYISNENRSTCAAFAVSHLTDQLGSMLSWETGMVVALILQEASPGFFAWKSQGPQQQNRENPNLPPFYGKSYKQCGFEKKSILKLLHNMLRARNFIWQIWK